VIGNEGAVAEGGNGAGRWRGAGGDPGVERGEQGARGPPEIGGVGQLLGVGGLGGREARGAVLCAGEGVGADVGAGRSRSRVPAASVWMSAAARPPPTYSTDVLV